VLKCRAEQGGSGIPPLMALTLAVIAIKVMPGMRGNAAG
jgi:hypothetical protein